MASKVTRIGSLDIQFQPQWDMVKANQLVQSVQQTIAAVNNANVAIAALQASSSGGGGGGDVTAPVLIADTNHMGPQVAVGPGLSAGQVLVAVAGDAAVFARLPFGQMADTDEASFDAPNEGDVIMFHTGFWTSMPDPNTGLGLSDPGQNAVVMWNEAGHAFAWAIPVAGGAIKLTGGAIAVDATQLDHSKFEGLHFTVANPLIVANDHPQYAMLAAANTWALLQTFTAGIVSNSNIALAGNLEQTGQEPEWRIQNTDDVANEGTWRMHAEPGQLIFSSVSDDGSDGENWLSVTRIGETVDAVNVSSNSFTWNGDDVLTKATLGSGANVFLTKNAAGQLVINAATASNLAIPPIGGGWSTSDGVTPLALPIGAITRVMAGTYTIKAVQIETLGGAGNCVVNVWKANRTSHYPPVSGDDITGGSPPTISGGTTYFNNTLSGWTTAIAPEDVFLFSLASTLNFTTIVISIEIG